MLLFIAFVLFALVFSFLCSIAEAVILSVTAPYTAILEKQGRSSGPLLRKLKANISEPLAAILTLNTIAHTIGAVGAGAQAAIVFGSAYLGIVSAVLTILILIFSEIIPKTLGAHHWRKLAPATAHGLRILVWLLYPFVKFSEKMTGRMVEGTVMSGFTRSEFAVMADLSAEEGHLAERESEILKNLLKLRKIRVREIMTPRTVMFTLPGRTTVMEFCEKYEQVMFSRVPVYGNDPDQINGFILRGDLLLAQARGESGKTLDEFRREITVLPDSVSLPQAFSLLLRQTSHIAILVDEFGDLQGLLTLEDIFETLLGLEIVDEGDETVNMQKLARDLWKKRSRQIGFESQK